MQTLTFKTRKHTIIKLDDGKDYKIPNEFLVEEVERLLELKKIQEKLESETVEEQKQNVQVEVFWNNIFAQLEIIFQHFQPDITEEYLKKHVTHNQALEMLGFFQKYRLLAMQETQAEELDVKKKQ